MAAFGASDHTTGGVTTQLDTASINVTGSNLCLVAAACESSGSESPTMTFAWDPLGNDEAMTGLHDLATGSFLDFDTAYLNDPTPANAPVRVTYSASSSETAIVGIFFTAAGDIVAGDEDSDAVDANSPFDITVPNVVSGDLVVDFIIASAGTAPSLTVGADQTQRENATNGSYTVMGCSTQDGADGGVMEWTTSPTNPGYGVIHAGLRIPDGPAGGDPDLVVPVPTPQQNRRTRGQWL